MWIQSYMFISRENPYGSESFKLSFRKSSLLISPNPVVSYILVLKYKFKIIIRSILTLKTKRQNLGYFYYHFFVIHWNLNMCVYVLKF